MKNVVMLFVFLLLGQSKGALAQTKTGKAKVIENSNSAKLKKEQKAKRWKSQIELDRQKIRELLGVDMLGDVSKKFEELLKRFHGDDMDSFFQDDNLGQFLDDWDPFEGLTQGSSHWIDTPKERILILKYKAPKDSPIDIKIEKGIIQIKGSSEEVSDVGGVKTKSITTFNQSYNIPSDVDAAKVKFENKDEEILVKFPKLSAGQLKTPNQKLKIKEEKQKEEEQIRPLTPQDGDITL